MILTIVFALTTKESAEGEEEEEGKERMRKIDKNKDKKENMKEEKRKRMITKSSRACLARIFLTSCTLSSGMG